MTQQLLLLLTMMMRLYTCIGHDETYMYRPTRWYRRRRSIIALVNKRRQLSGQSLWKWYKRLTRHQSEAKPCHECVVKLLIIFRHNTYRRQHQRP